MKIKKRHKKNYSRQKKKTTGVYTGSSKPAKLSSNRLNDIILAPIEEEEKKKMR